MIFTSTNDAFCIILRDHGCVTPWNDILIGALARDVVCRIYAVDRHFEIMRDSGAGIALYQSGYGGAYNSH